DRTHSYSGRESSITSVHVRSPHSQRKRSMAPLSWTGPFCSLAHSFISRKTVSFSTSASRQSTIGSRPLVQLDQGPRSSVPPGEAVQELDGFRIGQQVLHPGELEESLRRIGGTDQYQALPTRLRLGSRSEQGTEAARVDESEVAQVDHDGS